MSDQTGDSRMTIAIGVATAGRREVLSELLAFLASHQVLADELIICPATDADVDRGVLATYGGENRIVRGPLGLPAQRNAILAACQSDILVFLDDDFLIAPDFLKETRALFSADPSIVVATGEVMADGILGPGLSFEEGRAILAHLSDVNDGGRPEDTHNAYGCNMIVRTATAVGHRITFDEALPLYAWLEDLDFSRQLAPYGRIVKTARLKGVHLGTKRSGRSPGRRLGYSQVANPIYLARKKTMSWPRALKQISRNILANAVRSPRPEHWVDRRGRLHGNLSALLELVGGRLSPSRILELK